MDYIYIEYSNSTDLGDILYHDGFVNRLYLEADVSKPEYELIEDGTENADGEFSPTLQKWEKKYSVRLYAQEYMVDALTLMAIHDTIYVTLKNEESSMVNDIEIDYTWDANIECWAEVFIRFTTEYIIKRHCDEDFDLCPSSVVTADDVYNAEDGGAGEDRWDAPESYTGEVSFFYTTSGLDGSFTHTDDSKIGFFRSLGGSWEKIDFENNQYGTATGLASTPKKIFRCSDTKYARMPFLAAVADQGGGVAKFTMIADGIEQMFIQIRRSTDGGASWSDVGDPVYASELITGYDLNVGAGAALFSLQLYTHSCDYGYSNQVSETVT